MVWSVINFPIFMHLFNMRVLTVAEENYHDGYHCK